MKGLVFPGLAPSSYEDVELFIKTSPYVQKRFAEASSVIGYSLVEAFKEANEWNHEVIECAFLANTIAILDFFKDKYGSVPDIAVGASFGGIPLIVHTGSLTYEETVWLAKQAAMLAEENFRFLGDYQTHFVYNLSLEDTLEIVDEFTSQGMFLELVGYMERVMCLSGRAQTIEQLKERLNHKPKCFSLHTMIQPIHSTILTPLKERARKEVYSQFSFKDPKCPVISDVNGEIIRSKDNFVQMLLDSYDHPVRWDYVSKKMRELELKEVYVAGPKNLFSQLLKDKFNTININPDTVTNDLASATIG
ncbi:hypothetical protein EI200_16535 [Peribacillus simplex]|uniref:hypothetical protein n=1 Tax=Peribacillus TaxID=2675229 RepID=UPI000F62D56D|nr:MULTISPECIES: hypothetical protein [Peribacillus]MDF1999846.1 hypothetical protein [Peribacillus frigoritolerans]RRN69534.1 hypothetical protein EI200_16535 [Peribacillus simplex]